MTSGASLAGLIIRWHTWSWAAHAGFEFMPDYYLDATFRRGVAVHSGLGDPKTVQFFTVDCPTETWDAVRKWAFDQLGKPYDWSAICGMAAHRDWHDPGSWFCSELVVAAFEHVGFPLLRTNHLDRVTPRDLLLSPHISEAV